MREPRSISCGNQRLPDVRLETSYRGNGLGGTQFLRGGGFPGLVTGTRRSSFGDALGQVFTSDYPTWSFGLTVSYPLGNSFEAASHARADVERRQAAQRISSLRVEAAETVRRAGRQIHSTAERVEAARASATLAQERLESERRRFEVGLSTTFLVTQAQRDLLEAEVNLLQTALEYRVGDRQFRSGAAGAAAGRRRHGGCTRGERRAAAHAEPARHLPSGTEWRVLTDGRDGGCYIVLLAWQHGRHTHDRSGWIPRGSDDGAEARRAHRS